MIEAAELEKRLKTAFPDAQVKIKDLTGGSDHYDVEIVSAAFEGASRIKRHRMVYAPLQDVMGGELHALALSTKTPSEAS